MLLQVNNIPHSMFLAELRQIVGAHMKFKNFFAIPKLNEYNQFEEQKKQQEEEQHHSKHNKDEKFVQRRRQYIVAYFEPEDARQAQQFVDEYNCKQISYNNRTKTTNFRFFKDELWNVQIAHMSFNEIFCTQQSREEQRNQILQKELHKANQKHQQFLELLQQDRIKNKKDENKNIDYEKEYKQRPIFETRQGECTFWGLL